MSYTELWIILKHNKEFLCITHTVKHRNSLLLNQNNRDDTPQIHKHITLIKRVQKWVFTYHFTSALKQC